MLRARLLHIANVIEPEKNIVGILSWIFQL